MNNRNFIKKLKKLNACKEAVEWCEQHGGSLEELWRDCQRSDWLWWLLMKTAMPTKDQSIRYARWCAERVQVYAVHACADAVTHAAGHAASASAAAAYAADTADTARDYSNSHERAAQANYIRQNFHVR